MFLFCTVLYIGLSIVVAVLLIVVIVIVIILVAFICYRKNKNRNNMEDGVEMKDVNGVSNGHGPGKYTPCIVCITP